MTPLTGPLKRALAIDGRDYVITIDPLSLKLTLKGHQKGLQLEWQHLISGESALAVALRASVGRFPAQEPKTGRSPGRVRVKSALQPRRK